jgi:hypothetical protein
MNRDLRSACVSLVRGSIAGTIADRNPRPVALGWKLESGMLPAADVSALCAWVDGALADAGAAPPRRWVPSAWLRALLAEYHAVRHGQTAAPARPPERGARCRRVSRPADCA